MADRRSDTMGDWPGARRDRVSFALEPAVPNPAAPASTALREFGSIRRVVVKVGSGVIAGSGQLRPAVISALADDVAGLIGEGNEVIMVVSGAVAAGFRALGMTSPPTAVVERQSAACVGQYQLMTRFSEAFRRHNIEVAQLLLMEEDIESRRRFISARHTLRLLLDKGIVPIINENDALADDEAKIGDNDHLAALVTNLISAELLVVLSTVDGVYRNGSRGEIFDQVDVGSPIDEHIAPHTSASGVGGMVAKVAAARLASRWGVPTVIANGTQPGVLSPIVRGAAVGTWFRPRPSQLSARKRWIAFRARSHGAVEVDAGARDAILQRKASLLPSGIVAVHGSFSMGARVDLQDSAGKIIAVGLVSYSADEIRRMQGRRRAEFKAVLGYEYVSEIINRDDLVVLEH